MQNLKTPFMQCYFLLRNNRESGPFTRDELKTLDLSPTDLIWIEGESTSWAHPTEIEGLKATVKNTGTEELHSAQNTFSPKPAVPSLQEYKQALGSDDFYTGESNAEAPSYYYHSKTFSRRTKNPSTNSFAIGSRVFGALVLLIALGLCAFVVMNMLQQFSAKPTPESEAVEIKSEVLPVSNSSHTAQAAQTTSIVLPILSVSKTLDSSRVKPLEKPGKTPAKKSKQASLLKRDSAVGNTSLVATQAPPKEEEVVEEKPEPPISVNRAAALQLSANDYKVGLFGGISDLEITLTNSSAQKIDKAVIEIEYLKPNGNVAKSQTVTAENIAPNSSKSVGVPSSSRGVKVRYHVLSAE